MTCQGVTEPEKAAQVYTDEQKSLGREAPAAVIDKALRRMRWEPDIAAPIEHYLNLSRALDKDLLAKARASR